MECKADVLAEKKAEAIKECQQKGSVVLTQGVHHPCTLQPNFTTGFLRKWRSLFKSAHLSRENSSTIGSHDVKLSLMSRVENFATEATATEVSSRQMSHLQGEG
jgi:hypothetical protein